MKCRYALLLVLWILWQQSTRGGKNPYEFWYYIDAHETRSSCEAQVKEVLAIVKRDAKKVLDSDRILGVTRLTYIDLLDDRVYASFRCVPDTIDPRPKELKR